MKLLKRKQKPCFDFEAENKILRLELDKKIAQCEELEEIRVKSDKTNYEHACDINNLEKKVKELESQTKHSVEAELAYNLLHTLKEMFSDARTPVLSNLESQRFHQMASLQAMGGGQQFRGLLSDRNLFY